VTWCSLNNLEPNALKTVAMVVDFRKKAATITPCDVPVDAVKFFWFLDSTITQELKWELTPHKPSSRRQSDS